MSFHTAYISMNKMNKFYGTILVITVWFIGFAVTLLMASIPKWNEWSVDDIRTFFCYFMAVMLFSVSPFGGGIIMYKVWGKA